MVDAQGVEAEGLILDQILYALSHEYLEDEDPLRRSESTLGERLDGLLLFPLSHSRAGSNV